MVYPIDYIIFIFVLSVLGLSSLFDIRTREVPEFLLYTLIFGSVLLMLFRAVYAGSISTIEYFPLSLIALFGFSYLMYVMGQWAGGDVQIMLGLSFVFTSVSLTSNTSFISLFINIMVAGGIYGLFGTLVLGVLKYSKLKKYFKSYDFPLIAGGAVAVVSAYLLLPFPLEFFVPAILFLLIAMRYMYLISTTVVFVKTGTSKLIEGDWIAEDVKDADGRTILRPKSTGLTKHDIDKLKSNKIEEVLVKTGLPFIPGIFLGVLITVLFGNPLFSIFISSLP